MLALTTVFTTLLISFAAAQNSSTSGGGGFQFDPKQVDLTTKNNWCNGERANCPYLCGGPAQIEGNTCFGETLTYNCTCANGSAPADIGQYQGTLPNFICEETFKQCRKANPGSEECKNCGKLMPTDVQAIATSSAAASSAAATSGGTTTEAAATASSSGAAGSYKPAEGAGLIGGLLAALLL